MDRKKLDDLRAKYPADKPDALRTDFPMTPSGD